MFDAIATHASDRYRPAGLAAWLFARGKVRGDPVYHALSIHQALRSAGTLLDIGCGAGLSLAVVLAVLALSGGGARITGSARPRLIGIESRPHVAALGRRALAGEAEIITLDARDQPMPQADIVLLFDVAHMMPAADQERLLDQIVAALAPGGHLLLRDVDASAGWRFQAVSLGNRFNALLRHGSARGFHFRTAHEWHQALAGRGLDVEARPAGQGTPFANMLFAARKPA